MNKSLLSYAGTPMLRMVSALFAIRWMHNSIVTIFCLTFSWNYNSAANHFIIRIFEHIVFVHTVFYTFMYCVYKGKKSCIIVTLTSKPGSSEGMGTKGQYVHCSEIFLARKRFHSSDGYYPLFLVQIFLKLCICNIVMIWNDYISNC